MDLTQSLTSETAKPLILAHTISVKYTFIDSYPLCGELTEAPAQNLWSNIECSKKTQARYIVMQVSWCPLSNHYWSSEGRSFVMPSLNLGWKKFDQNDVV